MEGVMWAIVLKPFALLFFLFGVAVFAGQLKRFVPECALKDLLWDKTFRTRHPRIFTAAVIGFYLVLLAYLIHASQSFHSGSLH